MTELVVSSWVMISLSLMVSERFLGNRSLREVSRAGRTSDQLMVLLTIPAHIGPVLLGLLLGSPPSPWLAGVGTFLGCLGVVIRARAMVDLRGRYLLSPAQQPDQEFLVVSGAYATVRHPGYLGIACTFTGLGVLAGGWLGPLWILPMLAGIRHRIGLEEKLLTEEFQNKYATYARAVPWRFLPHVY
ncbi:MAG TPA: isoprenylcysteine carboxylmethyltransferase family protein [Kineosporiaceae bacterium]|nr:isoprenylcysteine carboxylmethyltransferase family protein [Kineosporiaceae bacterium]